MQELNEYLQQLISKSGSELYLEPNKQPFVVTSTGNTQISNAPLPGAKINTMIFALIPNDVKQQLPSNSQVEFVHPHNLGDFNFLVQKSPSGFIVTVSPLKSNSPLQEKFQEEEPVLQQNVQPEEPQVQELNNLTVSTNEASTTPPPQNNDLVNEPVIELNSPPQKKNEFLDEHSMSDEVLSTNDYAFESTNTPAMEEYLPEEAPQAFDSNQQQEVEVEEPYSINESSATEQIFDVEQFSVQTDDSSTSVEPPENTFNNMKPQNSAPMNNQPTANVPASNVEAVPVQQPIVQAPKIQPQTPPQQPLQQQMQQPIIQDTPQADQKPAKVSDPVVASNPQAKARMDALFHKMNEVGASDLHMSVSVPPMVRKDGRMATLDQSQPALTPDSMKALLQSIMPQKNIEEFAERNDTDFAYEIKGLARFRANIFMDRKGMGGVFRIIPSKIMTAEDLNLSKHIMDLCELSKGLVVVTGPTGSGKSTTLCAMVDSINKRREDHIITIEDPIEFTHENKKCLVNQREVHNHTSSFKDALRAALREDPDILLVGEMRDLETISIAIETAETGHLVFGTLHTTTAASTIDRIIDQFPADRQEQIRVMLSESLRGVIAQTLLPKIGGGRIAALEVLLVTPAISNLIREGKTFQIPSAMQTGKSKGMVMLNDALMELVNKGLVQAKDAYIKSVDKEGFELLLKRNGKSI